MTILRFLPKQQECEPFWLTRDRIDWGYIPHRRTIAASLIKGVSKLEIDRTKGNNNPQQPPQDTRKWWEFFGFNLLRPLVDSASSYFGAVFKYNQSDKPPPSSSSSSFSDPTKTPPTYVIAFRGTIINSNTINIRDLWADVMIYNLSLQRNSRYHVALDAAMGVVDQAAGPSQRVWLVGHSLGSAVAMLVGQRMSSKGYHLQTYLFNPPFPIPPIAAWLMSPATLDSIRSKFNDLVSRGLEALQVQNPKTKTSNNNNNNNNNNHTWTPYFFLNKFDFICYDYIDYFKQRDKLGVIHDNIIAKVYAKLGVDTIYLISSARVFISDTVPKSGFSQMSDVKDTVRTHTISQWFQPEIRCEDKSYYL